MIRLPGVCIVCREPVVWNGKRWLKAPVGRGIGTKHTCPAERPSCGAWMPYARERCARGPRHRGTHRTAYALENDARRKVA
jgi:hypothetical protein